MQDDDLQAQMAIQTLKIKGRRNTYEELEMIRKATRNAQKKYDWSPNDF